MSNALSTENAASAATSGEAVVRIAGVQKIFDSARGRHEALRSIDLELHDGEFLTILGPSGCGKTTLLRILAGFEQPTRGDVFLDGRRITEVPPNKRPMTMVFQNYALFPHLTVAQNVAYGLRIAKVGRAERVRRVTTALEVMGLVGLGERLPGQLSGGQQQRVALARSVVVEPRVLLFDEPLSNLDARLRDQMRGELRRVQQQLGVTSVYVTHDQTEAMAMSDRIVVMSNGRIEQVGSPAAIYRRPVSLFVANFIGNAVRLPCRVVGRADGRAELEIFDTVIAVDDPGGDDAGGETLAAVIRPEDLRLLVDGEPAPPDALDLRGVLAESEYLGNQSRLRVELADGTAVDAIVPHDAANGPDDGPRLGDEVRLALPHRAVRAVRADGTDAAAIVDDPVAEVAVASPTEPSDDPPTDSP